MRSGKPCRNQTNFTFSLGESDKNDIAYFTNGLPAILSAIVSHRRIGPLQPVFVSKNIYYSKRQKLFPVFSTTNRLF